MFGWVKNLAYRFDHKHDEYQSYAEFLAEWNKTHDVCQEAADELSGNGFTCPNCGHNPAWDCDCDGYFTRKEGTN